MDGNALEHRRWMWDFGLLLFLVYFCPLNYLRANSIVALRIMVWYAYCQCLRLCFSFHPLHFLISFLATDLNLAQIIICWCSRKGWWTLDLFILVNAVAPLIIVKISLCPCLRTRTPFLGYSLVTESDMCSIKSRPCYLFWIFHRLTNSKNLVPVTLVTVYHTYPRRSILLWPMR